MKMKSAKLAGADVRAISPAGGGVPKGRGWKLLAIIALILVLIGASLFFAFNSTDIRLRWLHHRIETHAQRGNWEVVLKHSDRYLHFAETRGYFGRFYYRVIDNTKFALVKTGRLLEDFFAYTRYPGFGVLFPHDMPRRELSHPGTYRFLSDMGIEADLGRGRVNLDRKILQHWLANPQNQRAGEYVVMMGLSAKVHQDVMRDIDFLLENFDYAHIPRHVEEAIITHVIISAQEMGVDPREYLRRQTFSGFRIRPQTIANADNFFDWEHRFQNGEIFFSELQHQFGDTYWFHFLFVNISP